MNKIYQLIFLVFTSLIVQAQQYVPDSNNVLFVKQGATGTGDGSSWANAVPELADALKWANINKANFTSDPLQIWVAKGTYKPKYSPEDGANFGTNQNRDNSFLMVKNVELYGGFLGTETLLTERNINTNLTTLSGDIGIENDISDNTYHVVVSANDVGSAKIDGFTITKGNANVTNSITINSKIFYTFYGGGICNTYSSPTITNTTITNNTTNNIGGGIVNLFSSPTITNTTISDNSANQGGGIYNSTSSPIITNTNITNNSANISGGGIFNYYSSPTLTNTTISNNSASYGGGGYNYVSSPIITNTTISNNSCSFNGGGIYNHTSSTPTINNCIIWGNIKNSDQSVNNIYNYSSSSSSSTSSTPVYKYSLIQGSMVNSNWVSSFGTDGGNNIDVNPMFANPANGDFTLTDASPAINAGSNSLYGASLATDTDLAGNPRLFGTTIDMGAYENQPVVISPTNNVLFVKQGATGTGDGSSWANAVPELADALKWANINKANFTSNPLQIWVAIGTYKPKYSPEDGANFGTNQNRDNSFLMVKNVQLYGGFFGTETLLTERNFNTNLTTLSGDIGIENNISDNTYHVVVSANDVGSAKIDGFTITKGNANGSGINLINTRSIYRNSGGGIYNYYSSPTITNTIITNNSANYGGGIYNYYSSPIITNTNISNNSANFNGGGNYNFYSSPTLTNTTISNNSAYNGGGDYNNVSSPIITNTTISNNSCSFYGGGIYNQGYSSPTLTNVTISNNSTNIEGGGIYNYTFSTPTINNCIIWGNIKNSDQSINNIYTFSNSNSSSGSSTSVYKYSLIQGSMVNSNWVSSFGTDGGNNIDVNPMFANPTNGDFTLTITSPAINAGSNSLYGASLSTATDLAGNPRLFGTTIDMGAYENQTCPNISEPTAINQAFCISENATIADLVATGTDIKWYETATSTTELATTTVLSSGSYFASQTVNGCESVNRAEIVVTIQDTAAPTAVDQEFCISENATIADLVAIGQNIKWYETATSTTALNTNIALVNGTSYFASQTLNNCESVNRTEVVVTIQDTAAPTAINQAFCIAENATIANLVATGTDIKWYDSVTSTTELATTTVLTSGSYFASQTENGCESVNRTEVVVTIQDTAAPTAINQAFCISENATIADLVAIGQNIKWYETATSTTELATTTVLSSGSYFASQTENGCESVNRAEIVVTIQDTAAPTAINQAFCIAENATIADLVVTGQNIKWYNSATSTNALDVTEILETRSYFASQTVNACESVTRAEIVVTIQDTAAPTTTSIQEFCSNQNSKISDLVITGTDIRWYASATSTTELNTNTSLVNGASYFATQTENGCESVTRAEVVVTIHNTPAPIAVDQEFCIVENATIADLVATGQNIKWYDSATSTTELATTTVLTSKSYFASQTENGCESVARKEVVVTIQDTAAPTAVDQEFCIAGNATIADLVATGQNIKWYDSEISTTELNTNTPLINGTSYFASQTLNNCESVNRTEVVVTIQDTAAPTAQNQEFCIAENATIADLVATGQNIKWYDSATSSTALNTNIALVNGTSYFASQTENDCESVNRAEVVVTIQDTAAPTATSIQEFCSNQNSKISDLVITGTDIRWYASATSTTELNTNTSLVNGASYFATQTENGCESVNRTEVQIQISTPPNLPSGDSIQTFCGNATIADLEIIGLPDAELIWYQTSYSNTILPTSTALANATYYVAQKVGACISDRKPVTARIINLSPPNVGDFEFCGNAVVADLYIPAPTGTTYKWYNSPSNPNELEPNTALNTGTYFVSKNEYNCETQRTAVSVVINDLPDGPTGVSPQTFIEGSVLNQIIINPTTAVYYITEEDARTSTNPLSPNMPLVNGTTYYAVVIGTNGCPSLPLPITVDVYLSNNEFEKDKLKYYPNPVDDKLQIEYFENIVQVDVYDLLGKKIKSINTNDRNVEIDLSELSAATYMIQLQTETKQQFIKIIKQ